MVGSLFPLHQLVEATTYTIGDPEYLRIFTKTYHQVWTEILSQGGYLVRTHIYHFLIVTSLAAAFRVQRLLPWSAVFTLN